MANSHVSRRNFITSVAAGAATVTALPPLQGFSNIFPVDQHLNADRDINIICTEDLSGKEQQIHIKKHQPSNDFRRGNNGL